MAGVLGGTLFVVWGYLDKPNISGTRMVVVDVLAFCVPALFIGILVGLFVLWRNRLGVLGWMGMALSVYGLYWGIVAALVGGESVWRYFAQKGWPHYLHDWLFLMLIGLALIGIVSVKKPLRRIGVLVLTMVASGWIYYLTDTNAFLEARLVHVGFGLLFSGCWVALGYVLWLHRDAQTGNRPRA